MIMKHLMLDLTPHFDVDRYYICVEIVFIPIYVHMQKPLGFLRENGRGIRGHTGMDNLIYAYYRATSSYVMINARLELWGTT